MTQNPTYNSETLADVLGEWEQTTEAIHQMMTALNDGIRANDYHTADHADEKLHDISTRLTRVADGLEKLRPYTRYPSTPSEPVVRPVQELEREWAVSGDRGYSIKIVGSEFTARRMVTMLGASATFYYRDAPADELYAVGTTHRVDWGTRAATDGWTQVNRG